MDGGLACPTPFVRLAAMNDAVGSGERAVFRPRPHRFPAAVVLAVAAWAGGCFGSLPSFTASAGALYRCIGTSGETVFSSSMAGYRGCRKIASFASAPAARRATTPSAALVRVKGSVATTARSLPTESELSGVSARAGTAADASVLPPANAPARRVSLDAVVGSVERGPVESPALVRAVDAEQNTRPSAQAANASPPATAQRFDRFVYYRVVHPDGSRYYGNVLPVKLKGDLVTQHVDLIPTCIACDLHSTIHWGSTALNLSAYAETIRAASVEYGVSEAFLRAIIHAESAFNPHALSLKGARGLMQLMPGTASDMGVMNAFDGDQNIRGGARYLSLLLHDFNGNERLAAAAYNAGPGAVVRYNGVPPYAETQVYVERVGTLLSRYKAASGGVDKRAGLN